MEMSAAPVPAVASAAPGYPVPWPGTAGRDPGYPGARTNPLAMWAIAASASSFVLVPFLAGVAGIVLGHIGGRQARERGEGGGALARWAIVLGWANIVVSVIGVIVAFMFVAVMMQSIQGSLNV